MYIGLLGHGADVKCIDWHPSKALVVSGSKDNQQPVKLWDPKAGQGISTLYDCYAIVVYLLCIDNYEGWHYLGICIYFVITLL